MSFPNCLPEWDSCVSENLRKLFNENRKYSAIVFDLGKVLIPFDYSPAINKLNQIEGGLGDRFIEFYKSNYHFHRDFERGNISENEFVSKMLEVVDHKIDAETFKKYYADIFSVDEDVISLLPILKNDYKLFLLSNTDSNSSEVRLAEV